MRTGFSGYQRQVVTNARVLAEELMGSGFNLVTGGTDNHLILMDLTRKGITGKEAEGALGQAGIVVNKNSVPFDKRGPRITSGLRLGTPAMTTRGMKEGEMKIIAEFIRSVLGNPGSDSILTEVREAVIDLCSGFPIYQHMEEGG